MKENLQKQKKIKEKNALNKSALITIKLASRIKNGIFYPKVFEKIKQIILS